MAEEHKIFSRTGAPLFTSDQAAARMGIDRKNLILMCHRHPDIRPAIRVAESFFWLESEIAEAARVKATAKRGRPAK